MSTDHLADPAADDVDEVEAAPRRRGTPRDMGFNVIRGFLMGSADIIPGVSGGTIALIVGIYERLVTAIRMAARGLADLVLLRWRSARDRFKTVEWSLVIPVLVGILIAIATLARLLSYLLDTYPIPTRAVFFGLVLASLIVPWRRIKKHDLEHYAVAAAAAAAAFFLVGLRPTELHDVPVWFYFLGGAVGSIAMILPGVSGAYLLEVIGLYEPVLDAVEGLDIGVLVVVGLGAVVGLGLFSQLLYWALRRFHDWTMAALTGLMLGSLRALWPWHEEGGDLTAPPADGTTLLAFVLMAVAIGGILVLVHFGARAEAHSDGNGELLGR